MVTKVLKAPVNLFFDTTTSGYIINRFEKDMGELDMRFSGHIFWLIWSFHGLGFCLYISCQASRYIIVMLPVIAGIVFYYVRYYIACFREMSRIESTSHSPIITHFGETLEGASTLRAYQKQHFYVAEGYEKIENHIRVRFWFDALHKWFSLRLEIVGMLVKVSALGFLIYFRSESNPIMTGLIFLHIGGVQGCIHWVTHMLIDFGKIMMKFERIK